MAGDKGSLKTGERRYATVLFSDMQGFTSLAENMDPEEVDSLITRIFTEFDKIVRQYDGTVEKYIGDALVAVFGVPRLHEDDPARAINTALDFCDYLKTLNRDLKTRDLEIQFKTGINTGLITTGQRGEYSVVTGHAMNIASRLQEKAPAGGILVSENTRQKCEEEFNFSERIEIKLKGTSEPVFAYRVIDRCLCSLSYYTPFINREGILNTLLRNYIKFDNTKIEGFFITGEPGIGKSRLLTQFLEKVKDLPGTPPLTLYAKAKRYRPEPFSLINDLLLTYLSQKNPGIGESDQRDYKKLLTEDLGVEEETAEKFKTLVSGRLTKTSDSGIFVVLYVLLSSIIKRNSENPYGVILAVDNCQNIDSQSLDFFRFYLKSSETRPFFLFSGRDEQSSIFEIFKDLTILEIPPLSPLDSQKLFQSLWKEKENPLLEQKILNYSSGNPLFMEEYIKYARSNREITTLPETIQNIYLSALEKLDSRYSDLIKKLSVFLQSFTLEDAVYIQEKTGGDTGAVKQILDYYLKTRYLEMEEHYYHFRSDLLKKSLYSSLLNFNKKILHKLVSELIKKQESPVILRLMHHLIKAEEYDEAGETLVKDPNYIQKLEYIPYLNTLIQEKMEKDRVVMFKFLFIKSAIFFNNGKKDESEEILREMIHLSVLEGKPEFIGRVYHLLCAFFLGGGEFNKTYFCGEKAIYYFDQSQGAITSNQNVYRLMALAAILNNDLEKNSFYRNRMEHTGEDGSFDMKIAAEFDLLYYTGEYRKALEVVENSLVKPATKKSEAWISAMYQLSFAYRKLGAPDKMKILLKQLTSIKYLSPSTLSEIFALLAESCFLTGERDKVQDYIHQSEYYLYQVQNDLELLDALKTLALTLFITGNREKAESLARKGIEIGIRHCLYFNLFTLFILMCELSLEKGTLKEGKFFLQEASFFLDKNILVDNLDTILYHYFAFKLSDPEDEDAYKHLEKANTLLTREKEKQDNPNWFNNLLALRSFGRIPLEMAKYMETA